MQKFIQILTIFQAKNGGVPNSRHVRIVAHRLMFCPDGGRLLSEIGWMAAT